MNSITKAAVALILATGTAAAYAGPVPSRMNTAPPASQETTMEKVEGGTTHLAKETWRGSKKIARETWSGSKTIAGKTWSESKMTAQTVVHSPVIAYETARGERPLFRHETASRGGSHHEQIALTGHKVKSHTEKIEPAPNAPPI